MTESTATINERIKQQARAAALKYPHVDDACPYPFHTEAARVFKDEFALARGKHLDTSNTCTCELELTVQELECGRCSSCGKAVTA